MAMKKTGVDRLSSYMTFHRLTCREMAALTGLSPGHVAYMLREERLGPTAAQRLAPVLGVPWEKLVTKPSNVSRWDRLKADIEQRTHAIWAKEAAGKRVE